MASDRSFRPPLSHVSSTRPLVAHSPGLDRLLLDSSNGGQFVRQQPVLLRARPDLQFWDKLIALARAAHTNAINLRSLADRRGKDWRALFTTERRDRVRILT